MNQRRIFVFIVLAIALLVPTVAPFNTNSLAFAQDDFDLEQVIATADGNLSVRLPADWVSMDNTGDENFSFFSSQLWWGTTQDAMNDRLIYHRDGVGTTTAGLGGGVLLADEADFQASFGYYPNAEELMDLLITLYTDSGATVEAAEPTTVNGMSGQFTVVNLATVNEEIALLVLIDTPVGTVLIISSGNVSNTSDNAGLLNAIALSVNAPAEATTTTSSSGTGDELPSFENLTAISDSGGAVSLQVPSGWLALDRDVNVDGLYFGDSVEAINSRVESYNADESLPVEGVGGVIAVFSYADIGLTGAAPANFPVEFLDSLMPDLTENGALVIFDLTDFTVYNGNQGAFLGLQSTADESGWMAMLTIDEEETAVFMRFTTSTYASFESQYIEMAGIIDTIRVPAEAGAAPAPTSLDAPTNTNTGGDGGSLGDVFGNGNSTNTGDTGNTGSLPDVEVPDGSQIYASNDSSLFVVAPTGWVVLDELASNNVFIVADSQEAINTRRANFLSDGDPQPVVGAGVVMTRFNLDDLNIGSPVPANAAVDLVNSLLPSFEQDGGLVMFPTEQVYADTNIQIAMYGGLESTNLETGFQGVALFDKERTLVAVIATSADSSEFVTEFEILQTAVATVRVGN